MKVILQGGALPKNIFWQVAGAADYATTSHFEGTVLSKTAIILKTGASMNGRLLAQTAVTLDANMVVESSDAASVRRPTFSTNSPGLRIVTLGDQLVLDMGVSASVRKVSIFNLDGMIVNQVSVPAGVSRTMVSANYAPANGFVFQIK